MRPVLVVALAVAAIASPSADAAAAPEGLSCSTPFAHPDREVVLLVHGTAVTADEHWGWNHGKHLPATGRDVCSIELPNRALTDIQVAGERVAAAITWLAGAHGTAVDVIGHSQGALVPRWAMRWWPEVAAAVDDAILLAGPHHGTTSTEGVCAAGSCPEAAWQMRAGSAFLGALNRDGDVVDGPDVSSIYSATDELVQPASTAFLDGAANVLLQDVCPGRPVHHAGLNSDPVVWALIVGTLDEDGPVDLADVDAATACTAPWYAPMTAADAIGGNVLLYGNGGLATTEAEQVDAEPPVRDYARSSGS